MGKKEHSHIRQLDKQDEKVAPTSLSHEHQTPRNLPTIDQTAFISKKEKRTKKNPLLHQDIS